MLYAKAVLPQPICNLFLSSVCGETAPSDHLKASWLLQMKTVLHVNGPSVQCVLSLGEKLVSLVDCRCA